MDEFRNSSKSDIPQQMSASRGAYHLGWHSYPARSPHLTIAGDLSDQELIEQQLIRSEETLRLACEGANVGIWRRDVATGKEVWSRKYYELYGFNWNLEPSFENWLNAVHPDDRALVLEDQRRMNEQRLTQLQNEFRIVRPDGIRWIREIGRNFYNEEGVQTEMVGIAIDITQQRRWQEEMQRASARKDEFLSMFAHELRNSLSVVASALMVAKSGYKPREWTDALIDAKVKSLTRLIGDLLDLARLTEGKVTLNRQVINVIQVASELMEQAKLLFKNKNQNFSVTGSSSVILANVDATRFEQVLTNLIHNACKYTPAGGDISVQVTEEQDAIYIAVKDNGIGIDPSALASIFDLYAQLPPHVRGANSGEPESAGLGIGLSVVKQLVDMHGGSVQAFSEGLGTGSTFRLSFPKVNVGGSAPQSTTSASR